MPTKDATGSFLPAVRGYTCSLCVILLAMYSGRETCFWPRYNIKNGPAGVRIQYLSPSKVIWLYTYAFLCRHVDQNQLQQVPYIRHDATTYYVCCLLVLCHLFCRKEIKIKSIYRKWQILYVMWLIQQSLHRSTLDNGMLQTAVQHSLQEHFFGCYLRAPDQTWFW